MTGFRLFAYGTLASVLLCLVASCAVMQAATPPAPTSPKQAFLLAAHETAAVLATANDAMEQGLISREIHGRVLAGVIDSRKALELAQVALQGGDLTTAEGQLASANAVLLSMRLLLTKGGTP